MKLRLLLLFIIVTLFTCFLGFSAFSQAPTTGLVAYFNCNGNLTNSGSASITAAGTGTTYGANKFGQANSALQFAGNTNSYVTFSDNGNLDFTGNFSVSFLFYFTGTAASGMIDNCLNYNGWGVWCWNTSGPWNIQFNFRNGSVGSILTQFNANTWYHVTAVRNAGTLSIYLNGALKQSGSEGTQTPSYPIAPIAGAMAYASFTPPRYNPYAGRMDELRIYNRALSAAEITQLASFTLPLQLGDITVSKLSSGNLLKWETLSEQNTSHFEIEKSADGNRFDPIGIINASGNSTVKRNYRFNDVQPFERVNFYRLKMFDIDGSYTYSRMVMISNDHSLNTQLSPNPTKDVLQIQVRSTRNENVRCRIINITGQELYNVARQLTEGVNAFSLSVAQLLPGNYHFIIESSEGVQSSSFIKQ